MWLLANYHHYSISTSMLPRFSVKPGLCTTSNGVRNCRLSASECGEDGTFVSGMNMIGIAGPNADCPLHKTLLDLSMGQCNNGSGGSDDAVVVCAPNPESCQDPSHYRPTTTNNNSDAGNPQKCVVGTTLFGACSSSSSSSRSEERRVGKEC